MERISKQNIIKKRGNKIDRFMEIDVEINIDR